MSNFRKSATVRVPAKVNMHLAVGALRQDGFHDVATLYHAVSLFDEVTVARANKGAGITVSVSGAFTDRVPTDRSNIAFLAAEKVAEHYGQAPDLAIAINKSIPVAAGLAGGSADAAGALLATDAIFGSQMSRDDLLRIAGELGSDVAFSLTGGTAIGTSRGERLAPALTRGTLHWVLVACRESGLAASAVYGELDRLRGDAQIAELEIPDSLMQALRTSDAATLGPLLSNDLQRAAMSLRPALSKTIAIAMDYGALGALVSGSGPTVAILVRDEEHALDLTVALTSHGIDDQIYRVQGPVSGARIVESL